MAFHAFIVVPLLGLAPPSPAGQAAVRYARADTAPRASIARRFTIRTTAHCAPRVNASGQSRMIQADTHRKRSAPDRFCAFTATPGAPLPSTTSGGPGTLDPAGTFVFCPYCWLADPVRMGFA